MAQIDTVIVDLQVSNREAVAAIEQATERLSELKVEEKELREAMEKGEVTQEAYIKGLTRIAEETTRAKDSRAQYTKALKENVKQEKIYSDSLNGLRSKLKTLIQEYDNMSAAERKSAQGKELVSHIQQVTAELSKAEQETGRFQRNVGNYPSALQGITKYLPLVEGGVSGITARVKALGVQMLKLLKNPIAIVIAGIVAALKALVDAFKRSDDAGTNFQSLLAALRPVLDVFRKGLEVVALALGKVAKALGDGIRFLTSWIPGIREAAAAEEELVQKTDQLEEAQRRLVVNSARRDAEISELRAKSTEKDKYSVEERLSFIDAAIKLEKEELKERQKVALERFRLADLEAKLNKDTSDETKNKLAELEAAVYQAQEAYNSGMRRLNAQRTAFLSQIDADNQAEQKKRADAAKAAREERKRQEAAELAELRALQDARLEMMAEGVDKQIAMIETAGKRQIEDLKRRLNEEKGLTKATREAINQEIIIAEAKMQRDISQARADARKAEEEAAKQRAKEQRDKDAKELQAYEEAELQRFRNDLEARLQAARGNVDAELALRQEEAAKELQIAQETQRRLSELTSQEKAERYESAAAYQLAMEQAAAAVIAAQGKVAEADKALTDQQKENAHAVKEAQMEVAETLATVGDNIQSLFENMAEQDERYADYAQAMAYVNILVSTSVSVAKAIEGAITAAAATGAAAPFTAPSFIAQMIAIATGALAQTTSLMNKAKNRPTYAEGGVIHGPGTGTSDSVTARVSNGESVLTAKATSMFYDQLSAMNVAGGGRPFDKTGLSRRFARGGVVSTSAILKGAEARNMAALMREAMEGLQPVVSVREITAAQNRVEVKEHISKW